MHVGIKTVDFGTIEVHTSLSQDRVGASLSTSHAELRSAMEAELPSLQQAISRHHLQLDAFDVASHTGGQGGDSSNDSRPRSFTNGQPGRILPSRESESAVSAPTTSSWIPPHSSRLSVIA
jgi:flagellar hook-length control protein FliK